MKLVVTTVGKDRVGIIAMVSNILAENDINILSVNQNIMDGFFNMIMMAETVGKDVNLPELQKLLKRVDSGRQVYYNHYTGKKWGDPHNYHMSLDSGTLGYDLCAKFIVEAIQAAD